MISISSPFEEAAFGKETKILLDACVLLGVMDKRDRMYVRCNNVINMLAEKDVKFFVSNVVLAEVLNKTTTNLFIDDLQFNFHDNGYINTDDNIDIIFNQLKTNDVDILLNSESAYNDLWSINYQGYFKNINKDKNSEIRNALKVYFEKANELCKETEKKYLFRFLPVNENIMNVARDMCVNYMLGINDAQHLSTAKIHRMEYIASTDGDFHFVEDEPKVKLMKV